MNGDTFQVLVDRHYAALYRFGLSLSGKPDAASDLVQQTFYLWAEKGHQLRDASKAKGWLFTTLYREYLATYRRNVKFPHIEIDETTGELPVIAPEVLRDLDGATVVGALAGVDEVYRAPLTLFYIDDLPYKEIADVLGVPIGTVMSRLSRGKEQLRRLLLESKSRSPEKVLEFPSTKGAAK